MKSLTLTGAYCAFATVFAFAQTQVPARPDCQDAFSIVTAGVYHIQNPSGAGNNPLELDGADCFLNGVPAQVESNSAWLRLTCAASGTLSFVITPDVETDDIDFVLFKTASGNCNSLEALRCMAAGDNLYPSLCMGPTGLAAGETDITEDAGCFEGDNNFLAPVNVAVDETYYLCVNNFSNGNGCKIEFGPGVLLDARSYVPPTALELSPNPVAEVLRIQSKEVAPFDSLEIVDMQGRIVQRAYSALASAGEISVRTLPPGTYWLRAMAGSRAWGGKFEKY